MNFSYYPVNHVDGATGAFVCQSVDNGTVTDLDCEGTRYDSCLVDVYGGGGVAKQRGIARFLRCYEGPYANEEALANASRREPCFRAAGLAFAPVRACYANRARVSQLAQRFNRSKALMMASLGAAHAPWDPGYFPHIFVDGKHQWNMTWTSLTRTLCAAIADSDGVVQRPPACAPVRLRLRFTVSGSDAVSGLGSGSSSGAPDRDCSSSSLACGAAYVVFGNPDVFVAGASDILVEDLTCGPGSCPGLACRCAVCVSRRLSVTQARIRLHAFSTTVTHAL